MAKRMSAPLAKLKRETAMSVAATPASDQGDIITRCTNQLLSAINDGNWAAFSALCDSEMTTIMPGQGQQIIQVRNVFFLCEHKSISGTFFSTGHACMSNGHVSPSRTAGTLAHF